MNLKILVLLLILPVSASAVEEQNNLPVESLFDFWVGDWDLSWTAANGSIGKGTNKIEKILDGGVIQESFSAKNGFKGRSLSVYNPQGKIWRQAWADNRGGFLNFVGETDGDKRIFRTESVEKNGNTIYQRMVFHSIEQDSFVWEWMQTNDNGKTWKTSWRISYVRKK